MDNKRYGRSFMLKSAFACLILLASSSLHASIVSYKGLELDPVNNTVSDGSIEWLQWNQTIGMSVSDYRNNIGGFKSQGWKLASRGMVADLFNRADFLADNIRDTSASATFWNDNENQVQLHLDLFAEPGFTPTSNPEVAFISLFGDTGTGYLDSLVLQSDPYQVTAAIFGADEDADNFFNYASVIDSYEFKPEIGGFTGGEVRLHLDSVFLDDSFSDTFNNYGLALFRPINVSAPNAIGLMFIMFLATQLLKRKNRLKY